MEHFEENQNNKSIDDSQCILVKSDDSFFSTETEDKLLMSELRGNNTNSNNVGKSNRHVIPLEINWRNEALIGNFMPAIIKLHKGEIRVDESVDITSENKLIHLTTTYSYLNVTRCLVELFHSDLNITNGAKQTSLHIACLSQIQDAYLLSYLIKQESLSIDACDLSGLSPIFYAVMNKFNIAILVLAYLKANLCHVDNFRNNLLYFAITADNKFALKFLIRHMPSFDLNQTYYGKSATLADILITGRNSSCTSHLVKYYHNEINLSSIQSVVKDPETFNVYNKFNYDLINTLYLYKQRDYIGFFKALIGKSYDFKLHNVRVMFYDLMLPNVGKCTKLFIIWVYSIIICYVFVSYYLLFLQNSAKEIDLLSIDSLICAWQLSSLFTLLLTLVKFSCYKNSDDFYVNEQYTLTNPIYTSDTVCRQLYDAMERDPLELFFEEEICEICLIKKDINTNHCHICKRCVKEFYFHSKLFNICFNRSNIYYYILLLSSISALHLSLVYLLYNLVGVDSTTGNNLIYTSQYFLTNIVSFFSCAGIFKLFSVFIFFITGIILFQKMMTLIICYGYKTTYYNMFRYHKKSIGAIQERQKLYYNVPQTNLISIWQFLKNIFKK